MQFIFLIGEPGCQLVPREDDPPLLVLNDTVVRERGKACLRGELTGAPNGGVNDTSVCKQSDPWKVCW